MEETLAELRGLCASTGATQIRIARRLEMRPDTLNRILRGKASSIPADFEARFRRAVADLAAEDAQAERDAAEAKAQALLRAAGVVEEVAA